MGMLTNKECRNVRLTISYDGSEYLGWQKQKFSKNTVQEILEDFLSGLLKERVRVIGAGRTDAGAHAIRQVVNFKTTNFSIPVDRFKIIMNNSLPSNIRVLSSEEVPLSFHSRFSAKFRKYLYIVFVGDEKFYPFLNRYSFIPFKKEWNVDFMDRVARKFIGQHDFLPISSVREYKSTVRFVKKSRVFKYKDFIIFSFVANGFMYNMVRGMVSAVMEAEVLGDENFVERLLKGIEKKKPTLVPANGLYLHRVFY